MFRCLIESLVSFLAAFLLAACTDDSSGYEVVDARAKETASAMNSYDIEIKFETTVRYTSQNYRWFNILFIPDSVVLREIDAYGLSNPNGFNTTGFPDSLSFLLSEVPLNKPFVELSFYGRWTRLRGDSLYVVSDPVVHRIKRGLKNRSDTIKVSFNDFVEMGLVQKNLDEGLSVYASIFKANMMADSYMDSLGVKGFLLPLWSFSFEKENGLSV